MVSIISPKSSFYTIQLYLYWVCCIDMTVQVRTYKFISIIILIQDFFILCTFRCLLVSDTRISTTLFLMPSCLGIIQLWISIEIACGKCWLVSSRCFSFHRCHWCPLHVSWQLSQTILKSCVIDRPPKKNHSGILTWFIFSNCTLWMTC